MDLPSAVDESGLKNAALTASGNVEEAMLRLAHTNKMLERVRTKKPPIADKDRALIEQLQLDLTEITLKLNPYVNLKWYQELNYNIVGQASTLAKQAVEFANYAEKKAAEIDAKHSRDTGANKELSPGKIAPPKEKTLTENISDWLENIKWIVIFSGILVGGILIYRNWRK